MEKRASLGQTACSLIFIFRQKNGPVHLLSGSHGDPRLVAEAILCQYPR